MIITIENKSFYFRPVSVWFVSLQLFDFISSIIGIFIFGMGEYNPLAYSIGWLPFFTLKFVYTILGFLFLECTTYYKFYYFTLIFPFIYAIWNILQFVILFANF